MGLRTAHRLLTAATPVPVPAGAINDPSLYPIATPWGSADLARIVYEDVFGTDPPPNTRSSAMRLPGLARARNLVVSTIARFPFEAVRGATVIDPPSWFTTCHDGSSWQHRTAWTVDDLIFYGWSLWESVRGADGFPLSFARINVDRWTISDDYTLEVDGEPIIGQAVANYTLIPGLHEGVLTFGVDAIRDARTLYRIVSTRLNNPVPQVDLHQTGGRQLNEDEIDALIDRWAAARQGTHGGVAYTNEFVDAREFGAGGEGLLIEARNAAVLDLARLVGVHGGMVDATTPKASLNYETNTGRNQEFVDFDLALYMTPITGRLSLDDVVPHGQRVAFDLGDFTALTPAPTGPEVAD